MLNQYRKYRQRRLDKPKRIRVKSLKRAELSVLLWQDSIASFCDVRPKYIRYVKKINPEEYRNIHPGDIVFVFSELLRHFIDIVLPSIQVPFILVSMGGDTSVPHGLWGHRPDDLTSLLKDQRLIHWFAQNCDEVSHTKISPLPIGFDFNVLLEYRKSMLGKKCSPKAQEQALFNVVLNAKPIQKRKLKAFANFHFGIEAGHRSGRDKVIRVLAKKEEVIFQEKHQSRVNTWKNMVEYAFCISPEGLGADCYRTWEALALGCIPIVKRNFLSRLYQCYPIVIVDRWEDITPSDLEKCYDQYHSAVTSVKAITLPYWVARMRTKQHEWRLKTQL